MQWAPQISGTTLGNLVSWATWRQGSSKSQVTPYWADISQNVYERGLTDGTAVQCKNVLWWCWFKTDSHIACCAHAVLLPCRVAKGLERVFPIWLTQCGRVWFTLAMPRPCHAPTIPFFSRPRYSTSVERQPVGYLHAFGFLRLPRGVPRRLLSEAYHSYSQRSIPTTVKSGSSTLQEKTIC
jgi:hypothetical protein